jgi:hypothetical protein
MAGAPQRGTVFTPFVIRKPGLLVNMVLFLILMVAWAIGLVVVVRRKLREVQREVDEIASL